MKWLKDNVVQILLILVTVTFGYANFTRDIQANADDIQEVKSNVDKYNQKLDTAIKLLERIDERTKRL